MKKNISIKTLFFCLAIFSLISPIFAQTKRKPIIFAVLDGGKTLEPIAFIESGKLTATVDGGADGTEVALFDKAYYKPKSAYSLIFGGTNAGTANVVSYDLKADCAKNTAQITVRSTTKLTGNVMALATDAALKKSAVSFRRKPTAAEKTLIDAVVRAEFAKQKVSAATLKNLQYQNLTALDIDGDKTAEFVGSYWVNTSKTDRALLFFIAEKNAKGKYELGYSEFKSIKQADVMSKDIKNVDDGIYHELLLDAFDYDNDGTSEIFTYVPSFEGAGFNAYKRENGKWTRSFEGSNYHCAY